MGIVTRGKAAFRKTYPDMKALLLKQYPGFVYGAKTAFSARMPVPIFCYHGVEPETFEQNLIYLKENGYSAIDSAAWLNQVKGRGGGAAKAVLLTFDDGDISLFRTAFPLLKKYGFKAVSFICPGLIPEGQGEAFEESARKLCTWAEIREMHASGVIDFQCHSFNHDLVFTSDELIGFVNPGFKSQFFGRNDHAVVVDDGIDISLTNLCSYETQSAASYWGAPVYQHKPRMAADQRFISSGELRQKLTDLVQENGGQEFFRQEDWEKALRDQVSRAGTKGQGELVKGKDYQAHVASELERAKQAIEEKLPGKKVEHLCPPWFAATEDALQTAEAIGFRAAFLGVEQRAASLGAGRGDMARVQRLSFKYITRLPGKNRTSLLNSILDRSG